MKKRDKDHLKNATKIVNTGIDLGHKVAEHQQKYDANVKIKQVAAAVTRESALDWKYEQRKNNKPIQINVADIIGSTLGIAAEDGQRIFDKAKPLIAEDKDVVISFERITILISLFLNVVIGQLYGHFDESTIKQRLKVEGLAASDMHLLKLVVENAKKYYANKEVYDRAWEEEYNA